MQSNVIVTGRDWMQMQIKVVIKELKTQTMRRQRGLYRKTGIVAWNESMNRGMETKDHLACYVHSQNTRDAGYKLYNR